MEHLDISFVKSLSQIIKNYLNPFEIKFYTQECLSYEETNSLIIHYLQINDLEFIRYLLKYLKSLT
jgi:hypothetical protein